VLIVKFVLVVLVGSVVLVETTKPKLTHTETSKTANTTKIL